jgi:hypothetical protein
MRALIASGWVCLVVHVAVSACLLACVPPGFNGENRRIVYQPNGDRSLLFSTPNRPIALHGTALYGVALGTESDGAQAILVAVESLTPEVVEVVSFDASTFVVRGVGVGIGRVRTVIRGAEDVAPLTVHEVARIGSTTETGASLADWREAFASEPMIPPSDTLALRGGEAPLEVHFSLRDEFGTALFDRSALLVQEVSANDGESSHHVDLVTGGGVLGVDLTVAERPDRLVRHGGEADVVWGLTADSDFCVAPMVGRDSLPGWPLRAEVDPPWVVEPWEGSPEDFATCFTIRLDPALPPPTEPAEITVTDGSLRFLQRVDP